MESYILGILVVIITTLARLGEVSDIPPIAQTSGPRSLLVLLILRTPVQQVVSCSAFKFFHFPVRRVRTNANVQDERMDDEDEHRDGAMNKRGNRRPGVKERFAIARSMRL